jgi:hypothetical protein
MKEEEGNKLLEMKIDYMKSMKLLRMDRVWYNEIRISGEETIIERVEM